MADGFDISELQAYTKALKDLGGKAFDRAVPKMLRTEGTAYKKQVQAKARARVNRTKVERTAYSRKAGTYHRSFKRGKAWKSKTDYGIRVFSPDPISHLIEMGYRLRLRDGRFMRIAGKAIVSDAEKAYAPKFYAKVSDFIDKELAKL